MVKLAQQLAFQARVGVEPDVMPTAVFDLQIIAELPKWEKIAAMSGASQE